MKRLSFIASALVLAGCATEYQQQGWTGGFSETQLSENVWRVSFQGNGYTGGNRAADFALLRSADLTLANGFTHFALADSKAASERAAFTSPRTATTTGSGPTRFSGGNTTYVSYPSANNTVVMFKGKPDIAMAFDARFICTSLGKKYQTTCQAMTPSTAMPVGDSRPQSPGSVARPPARTRSSDDPYCISGQLAACRP